jgi:hypothetical protein
LLKHLSILFRCHVDCSVSGIKLLIAKAVEDSLVRIFQDVVFSTLAAIHLYSWSSILPVKKRVFPSEKQVQFIDDLEMVILDFIIFYNDSKLSLRFLQRHNKLKESRQDLILAISHVIRQQFVLRFVYLF